MVDNAKIRRMRTERGLTIKELAEKVCTSPSMVTYVETGIKKPGVELLKRFADFFGCTVDELLN